MTVRIDNLHRTFANSQIDHIGFGLTVNAYAYGANTKFFTVNTAGKDIVFVDANGVLNVMNSVVIAGINVLPLISSTSNNANSIGVSANVFSGYMANSSNSFAGYMSNSANSIASASYVKLAGRQTIANGFSITAYNAGANVAAFGTWTPDPANGNYQYANSNGAVTIAAPSTDCAIDVLFYNGMGANSNGAQTVAFSGYTVQTGGTGDPYATTANNKFLLMIRRINGISTYIWKTLQ